MAQKIKTGDRVLIIKGKDRGKTGKVLVIHPEDNKAVVENANLVVKHLKPRQQKKKGERVRLPAPISIANLKIICPKCQKATRIGFDISKKPKKRTCKKCDHVFD